MVPGGTKQKSSRAGQLHSKRLVLLQLPACESHFQFYSGTPLDFHGGASAAVGTKAFQKRFDSRFAKGTGLGFRMQ